jgi:hypothetical protein
MSHRFLMSAAAAVIGLALLAPKQAASQIPSSTAKKAAAGKPWKPSRTPDGQPDFQGVWDMATLTALERPAEFAGKEFLTEQEAAEFEKRTLEQLDTDRRDGGNEADLRRNYNQFWRERGNSVVASRRTSLIVDPPDGKIPAFTPEWRSKRAARAQAARLLSGPEDLALRIRCITRGLPMVPTPNNNFFRIVQSQGYVTILQEMMYEARIIPLDGRPHAPQGVRGYMGDARGHWEGDTLVIDTTNFFGKSDFLGSDENLHLTEYLTRTDGDTIIYRFTINDPTAFTRSWSGEVPMRKATEDIFPYECQEGNYSLPDILGGARAEEKRSK